MKPNGIFAILLIVALPFAATADDLDTRILVTFSDPGMSNASRAGPAGPGYRRRSSMYLTSVSVKRAANRIARDFALVKLDEWPIVPLKVHCLVFGVTDNIKVDELLIRLRQRPEVESAQLLNQFEVTGSTSAAIREPYAGLQHHLETLELTQAHNWSRGNGTHISVIDTGADLEHPELAMQIANHFDFVEDSGKDFSADAHGTAVAGVIGAASNNGIGIVGVAPSSRLSILKACWHRPDRTAATCDSFTLAKALGHAIDSDTDVINLSLAGPSDALLGRLASHAMANGIMIVAAAPKVSKPGFPADTPGVIVVASSDESEPIDRGASFLIRAPGEDILVPVPRGGYDYASGSSLSAAQVSGIVALLIARRADLTIDQVNSLLIDSRPAMDASVNACRALAQLLQETGCMDYEAVSQRK